MAQVSGLVAEREPWVGGVGLLAVVPDRWEEGWSTRHHILSRLSQYFHVVWVNPAYGLRLREWRRRWAHKRARLRPSHLSQSRPGLIVFEPASLYPSVGRPLSVGKILDRQRLRQATRLLAERGCSKVILHVWRPYFARVLDLVSYDLACYHIDDEYSFSEVDLPVGEAEARLISRVDQVFVTSQGLLEKKGGINPHTVYVPNGVDFRAYADPAAEPPDIQPILHPRIGYSGVIKWTLDWSLLARLTLRHPSWHFVFVGPVQPHSVVAKAVRELSSRPNVHFLGGKSASELTAYPQHFDICMMPYRMDSHSVKYGYPLKLHEYLAAGRPTVGTPLHALLEFGDLVRLARTEDEWSEALSASLAPGALDPARVDARRAVARRHDWNLLVRVIARAFCERLGPSYLERFQSIPAAEEVSSSQVGMPVNR